MSKSLSPRSRNVPGTPDSALSNVQLGLDVISIFASMLLAANLHARLRPIFPVLRGTPLFHEHAT
ncbi:MAG TPA: hypothetical protein VF331_23075, partial [Polyangiales bacterium]